MNATTTRANDWTTICIPGRDDTDEASWFAYSPSRQESVECRDRRAAAAKCRELNG